MNAELIVNVKCLFFDKNVRFKPAHFAVYTMNVTSQWIQKCYNIQEKIDLNIQYIETIELLR